MASARVPAERARRPSPQRRLEPTDIRTAVVRCGAPCLGQHSPDHPSGPRPLL